MLIIGHGFDSHKFIKADNDVPNCKLGGISISNGLRFKAHSDGDVLIHSLIDSLIGSTLKKDIGELFPNTKSIFKNINSEDLLIKVLQNLKPVIRQINSIDITIICDTIKINPIKIKILENLKSIISPYLSIQNINVKGKTTEGSLDKNYCYVYCVSLINLYDK